MPLKQSEPSGIRLAGDLVIACVLAELQGGLGTKYLIDQGYKTDVAVVTEPYGAHHIVTKHAGMANFSLHVKTTSSWCRCPRRGRHHQDD